MIMDNGEELLPIVDINGSVIGSIKRADAHSGSGVLHPVVHLHVFNSRGSLYLQKRPQWKDVQPGRWDTACGGHVAYGEIPEEALRREVSEELGITDFNPLFLCKYIFKSVKEKELVYVNLTTYNKPIYASNEELDGGRFWSPSEIMENIGKAVFTPNFESEYLRFFHGSSAPLYYNAPLSETT
jgi:isopentenyldiphosphate isomerase